eukprot:gene45463-60743_t
MSLQCPELCELLTALADTMLVTAATCNGNVNINGSSNMKLQKQQGIMVAGKKDISTSTTSASASVVLGANDDDLTLQHPFIRCLQEICRTVADMDCEADIRCLYYAISLLPDQIDNQLQFVLNFSKNYILEVLERIVSHVGGTDNVDNAFMSSSSSSSSHSSSSLNKSEDKVAHIINDIFQRYPGYTFLMNNFLLGFEADIIIHSTTGVIINVEVDGPTHEFAAKKRFCVRRDEILKKQGVRIIRIKTGLVDALESNPMVLRQTLQMLLQGEMMTEL